MRLRPAHATLVAALALSAPLALPSAGLAAGGGASPDLPPGFARAVGADGVALLAPSTALLRQRIRLTGQAPVRRAGALVVIERRDPAKGWLTAAKARVRSDGGFAAGWRSSRLGRVALRAHIAASGARGAADAPAVKVTVFRPGVASWFAPQRGAKNERTACGVRFRPTTIGVAHRSLPCGTRVAFSYRGTTIVVPVIDRGPYIAGRDWDLTIAAAREIGLDSAGVGRVGTLILR